MFFDCNYDDLQLNEQEIPDAMFCHNIPVMKELPRIEPLHDVPGSEKGPERMEAQKNDWV